ncbi:FAD-dependent oxidoreductase [Fundicoccus ignavus]|uniref:Uncharacterized protein n=1 Tax=Fundicoccus ignavus TaxID=2664442 RepID=A0A844BVL3_9LACT|nr:FAD-dependent oxidoreductase [Fundicoccus ignavus]MRJ46134.1 hypothetical protein [Fundicoccus ignavus]
MKPLNIVIIGASFAGITSALTIKRLAPATVVTVIEREETVGFIPSSVNRLLKGQNRTLTEQTSVNLEQLVAAGIELKLGCEVVAIESAQQYVRLVKAGQTSDLNYDKLILAMGSHPQAERIRGANLPGVLTTKTLSASEQSQAELTKANRILIVGGGQVGLEAADAYAAAGKTVTIVEAFDSLVFKYFDAEMVSELEARMVAQGVKLYKNQQVEAIGKVSATETEHSALRVRTSQHLELLADRVLLAVNFRPNSQLVAEHLATHLDRTLVVNEYLQTSQANIYAAGDLIRVPYLGTENDYYLPFVNNAMITGRLAAMNALGLSEPLQPVVRVMGSHLFGLYIASAGLTEEEAKLYHRILTLTQVHTDESDGPITLKLIIKQETGQVLGGQVYSQVNVLGLIDVLALAIKSQLTDRDLAFQDYHYYSMRSNRIPILNKVAFDLYEKRLKEVGHDAP